MASIACMNHENEGAVFVGTFLESGQSVTVCTDCLVDFMTVMLEAQTGAPVAELIAHQLEVLQAAAGDEPPTSGDDDGPASPESSVPLTDTDDDEHNVAAAMENPVEIDDEPYGGEDRHIVTEADADAIIAAAHANDELAPSPPVTN